MLHCMQSANSAPCFRGHLIAAGEPGYDEARKVYNGMIDKRPALIVCCAT